MVGTRRAASAAAQCRLEVVVDLEEERAKQLADRYESRFTSHWEDVVTDRNVDAVAVCTSNNFLAPITIAALEAGKHVLCEKPMGRNSTEAVLMASAAGAAGRILKVGFTLRFHPAIRKAHQICADGELGPVFSVEATYGHGGRPGYEKEWRGNAELAGGGELLDQGVHLLDLSRWFLGDVDVIAAVTPRWHWDVAPLEDNAFIVLQTRGGQVASLHTSWTQWKNRFSFEVFGRDGYARVDGLGGSYGLETLTVGRKKGEGAAPAETVSKYQQSARSWEADWRDFITSIEDGRDPEVGAGGGLATMRLVDEVYALASANEANPAGASAKG